MSFFRHFGLQKCQKKPFFLSITPTDLKIESVSLVGSNQKLIWSQGEKGLAINAATKYPTKYAAVFKLKIKN